MLLAGEVVCDVFIEEMWWCLPGAGAGLVLVLVLVDREMHACGAGSRVV